ncbi:uncharacterized protein MONBRDRAFT_1395, partial [Monosiga brevicollis MX1]
VKFRSYLSNTVLDACLAMGWAQTADDNWDLFWCDTTWARETYVPSNFPEHCKICHFPQHYELTRKDFMAKNLKDLQRRVAKNPELRDDYIDTTFMPATYWLPHDYGIFVEAFRRQPGSVWIMKPVGSAQGKGIFLIKKLSEILAFKKDTRFQAPSTAANEAPPQQSYIVQRYLDDPYLIGGKKFDLRLYVLVTAYQPLECWTYREGFARFSGFPFSMEDISNSQVHLTNVAVQKKAEGYDEAKGCKWLMTQVCRFLEAAHGHEAVQTMVQDITKLAVTSLRAVQARVPVQKHCFELYGFDVLLDARLKPWLIEVNASPSLTADTETDYHLKCNMLQDAFHVLDIEHRRTLKERRVGNFDLTWQNGPV